MRTFISAGFITLSLLAAAPVLQAQPAFDWSVTISSGMPPPPVVRSEPIPPGRSGAIWVQGYWNWNGVAYAWVPGRWVAARAGYAYVQPAWREGPNGWDLRRGGWHRGDQAQRTSSKHGGGPGHCPPGHRKKGEC